MNFDTARLLRLPPLSALMVIVNDSRNTRLNPNQIRVTGVASKGERVTEVSLETFESPDRFVEKLYKGSTTFTYHRLDLQQIFDNGFLVQTLLPTTTYNVLQLITDRHGIVFDEDDFENIVIRSGNFLLVPKPESLRWVGSVVIKLDPNAGAINLADIINVRQLNGLTYDGAAPQLAEGIPVTQLSGLTYET